MKKPYEHAIDKWKKSIIEVHAVSLEDGLDECKQRGDGNYRIVNDSGTLLVEVVNGVVEQV